MSNEQAAAVLDLMDRTRWDIAGYCAHITDEDRAALQAGGEFEFWAFTDFNADGVGTCILSASVLAEARRLAPDMTQLQNVRPVDLQVGE